MPRDEMLYNLAGISIGIEFIEETLQELSQVRQTPHMRKELKCVKDQLNGIKTHHAAAHSVYLERGPLVSTAYARVRPSPRSRDGLRSAQRMLQRPAASTASVLKPAAQEEGSEKKKARTH